MVLPKVSRKEKTGLIAGRIRLKVLRPGWGETGVVVVWIWGKIVIHISECVLSRRVAFTGFNMVGKLDMDGVSMSKDMLPWKGLWLQLFVSLDSVLPSC